MSAARTHRFPFPWTNVYGLARTLVALGTIGTLAASSTDTLFRPVATLGDYPPCRSTAAASVFCLADSSHAGLTWIRWICVAVLLVVASGWRPRLTALPHLYINYSVFDGISIVDGGDQIGLVLSVLFVLPALGDPRRWHWQPPVQLAEAGRVRKVFALLGLSSLVVLKAQMCVLYFQAAVAKLPHSEWADGTAMWYWGTNPDFGPASWLSHLVTPVLSTSWGVAGMTWIPLAIELSLAVSPLVRGRARWYVMAAGLLFHLSIAVMMGLWSFALGMAGGILVLCAPLGAGLTLTRTSEEPAAPPVDVEKASRTPVRA
ncbi:HTTM domain-containing protein [Streptomyces sp. AV19]|uniref:sporulation-delaying protein SdpB family protein n=1 Tax=Streptomyces sp. AV19 TaxID=2793068 RepID=UPI0018FE1A6C|nr:sporulation-delaying protein SdpB family protein [Streptomyces sp. AV19]MBH1933017.1 HTTM domain-containing protein [Streptomyces sp. AV19]MDG4531730.1 HTTM domain-containing protein [Streptomyces sp. AV19]